MTLTPEEIKLAETLSKLVGPGADKTAASKDSIPAILAEFDITPFLAEESEADAAPTTPTKLASAAPEAPVAEQMFKVGGTLTTFTDLMRSPAYQKGLADQMAADHDRIMAAVARLQ